tara:strand:+ start:1051 stop:1416 length:366 start_codon:yes stop_codon:yes gene_type:complete
MISIFLIQAVLMLGISPSALHQHEVELDDYQSIMASDHSHKQGNLTSDCDHDCIVNSQGSCSFCELVLLNVPKESNRAISPKIKCGVEVNLGIAYFTFSIQTHTNGMENRGPPSILKLSHS